jgi:5-(carboxyamino)imidazole ribonucleotide mutase
VKDPLVSIVMGSDSDLSIMVGAADVLASFDVPCEVRVLSAHRVPERVAQYASRAKERGVKVIIAGAGLAAHLAGAVAANTTLPVIGVPLSSSAGGLGGLDALLATVQMPTGVPVATVAIDGAKNAGHLAVRILAAFDPALADRVASKREAMQAEVLIKDARIKEIGVDAYLTERGEKSG